MSVHSILLQTWSLLRELERTDYVQTLFGFEPRIRNPFGNPQPNDPVRRKNPIDLRILGLIFILRTYFRRLTGIKSNKARANWVLISDLLELISPKDYSPTDLSSWWRKDKKYFEIYDEETFLDSYIRFYENHTDELDTLSEKWLQSLEEYRENPL
jgi:hypothetical protein